MKPHYTDGETTVYLGDCIEVMHTLPDASVDAVVTDPPYGLEFMGKAWDSFGRGDAQSKATAGMTGTGYTDGGNRIERPSYMGGLNPRCKTCGKSQRGGSPCRCEKPNFTNERLARSTAFGAFSSEWAEEAYRVLKPGGHILAFGGSRTWHRLAVAIEDAGFELRDSIAWLYGSGFPKSMDVSKAIDKAAGAEREIVPVGNPVKRMIPGADQDKTGSWIKDNGREFQPNTSAPATDAAREWEGWGTALKPAFEPIVVGRKPLVGTVAANVLAHGVGALNIDATRVGHASPTDLAESVGKNRHADYGSGSGARNTYGDFSQTPAVNYDGNKGRWPTNVLLDDSQAAALDAEVGYQRDGVAVERNKAVGSSRGGTIATVGLNVKDGKDVTYGSGGGPSRFFPTFKYQAKAPKSERPLVDGVAHATVKPIELMRWLIRLVVPKGATILEPFAGSGTTVEAAILEGVKVIAIEREEEYWPLIRHRIARGNDVL